MRFLTLFSSMWIYFLNCHLYRKLLLEWNNVRFLWRNSLILLQYYIIMPHDCVTIETVFFILLHYIILKYLNRSGEKTSSKPIRIFIILWFLILVDCFQAIFVFHLLIVWLSGRFSSKMYKRFSIISVQSMM